MAKTHIRPPSISSAPIRNRLSYGSDPALARAVNAIDMVSDIYDGLIAVRENQSPMNTREANAVAFRAKCDKVKESALRALNSAREEAVGRMVDLSMDADRAAGILKEPHNAAEIRAALRSMTQKDRDAAILDAMKDGDSALVAATLHATSPITVGHVGLPRDTMMEQYRGRFMPDYAERMEALGDALTSINLAAEGFTTGANRLRDTFGENSASEGERAARSASQRLADALGGKTVGEAPNDPPKPGEPNPAAQPG